MTTDVEPARADDDAVDSHAELPGHLFDGTSRDRDVTVTRDVLADLDDRQILWIDLADPDEEQIEVLADLFDLKPESIASLRDIDGRPRLAMFGEYIQLFVHALESKDGKERPVRIAMIVGPNFVVTVHPEMVDFLVAFQDHLKGDTMIGLLDAPSFLAALLDWHLTGYFRVLEALEKDADELDNRALHPASDEDLLVDMVRLRRRISAVRRALAPHREVFASLTRPDLTALAEPDDVAHFRALVDRLERAIDSVEVARELVLGSFDVHMTRTAQRTNEIMKVLTLASVIVLPGSMIAGVMGMNFKVDLFENPANFWIVCALIVLIALATVSVARVKRWI